MLPESAHSSRPWRIHEIAHDFRVEDVWALPTPGGSEDFPRLVREFTSTDPSRALPGPARALMALRWKLGELFGWDDEHDGVGSRVPTLRDRLPADLRDAPPGPEFDSLPFSSLYLLEDEFAAETANKTMHGVLHLGWVRDRNGGYCGQMAVLVKPNGRFGSAYMAAIRPFRHWLVYPQMMRMIERRWRRDAGVATVRSLWDRIQARDWVGARRLLHDDMTCRWPHSDERFEGADAFIAMNRAYPEGWQIEVVDVAAIPGGAVSRIRVEQSGMSFHAASFFEMRGDLIAGLVEYWVTQGQENPPEWRARFSAGPSEC